MEKLITRSQGDTVIDYRNGDEAVISGIKDALEKNGTNEVKYAFDAVSEYNSYQNISQVLSRVGSKITLVIPWKEYEEIPEYIEKIKTMVGIVHMDSSPDSVDSKAAVKNGAKHFGFAFFRLFSRGLQEGWFTAHPYEIVPGGLNGVEKALTNLKGGVNSATKYIFRIEDTT